MPCAFPRLEIAFAQREKFKRNVLINVSSLNAKRTVKPDDAAQTLVPSTLKMAAWSRLPVAIRLNGVSVMSMMKITRWSVPCVNIRYIKSISISASMGGRVTAYLATTWQLDGGN